jgi:hypothetical protein
MDGDARRRQTSEEEVVVAGAADNAIAQAFHFREIALILRHLT